MGNSNASKGGKVFTLLIKSDIWNFEEKNTTLRASRDLATIEKN